MIEPHLPPFRRLEGIRRLFGENIAPGHMQYGATGPMALTYYVQQRGLSGQVLPSTALYSIPYEGIPADAAGLKRRRGHQTRHHCHQPLAQPVDQSRPCRMPLPPKGSAMAELCTGEGVTLG